MAGRNVSPGAALLRASRMFSMPPPLSAPPGDYSGATKHKSETATVAFPTRLTITTTKASRAAGDWGFKRPLPLKTTTKTTYPLIRVKAVDSIESITDFQSASDHTINLHKWQELNMPLTMPQPDQATAAVSFREKVSVFEEDSDITAIAPGDLAQTAKKRWRFKGPWLADMTDGQFQKYLNKVVRKRREEFREFIRQRLAASMTEDQAQQAVAEGKAAPAPVVPSSISDLELTDHIRKLRHSRIEIMRYIAEFLDLPPRSVDEEIKSYVASGTGRSQWFSRDNPYALSGPPITHPSAGLSYLRSRNFLENHPIYGPQKYHAPAHARIISPRNAPGNSKVARLGVGGFVSYTPKGDSIYNMRQSRLSTRNAPGVDRFEPDIEGGAKLHVDLDSAHIDSTGKVALQVLDAEEMSILVQREMAGDYKLYEDASKQAAAATRPRFGRSTSHKRRSGDSRAAMSSSEGYGFKGL